MERRPGLAACWGTPPRIRAVVPILLLASSLFASDPAGDELTFTGANTPGATTSITFDDNVYSFSFQGDESLIYQLDLSEPKVAGGVLRIREVSSDSYPIDGGGVVFRDAGGALWYPNDNYQHATLTGHSVAGSTLTLDYDLDLGGIHSMRYQITQDGKVLRIRVFDPTANLAFTNNFAGLFFGKTTGVEFPVPIQMQGTLAQPIVLFRKRMALPLPATQNLTRHFFTANMLDLLHSNAASVNSNDTFNPQKGPDWIDLNLDTVGQYKALSNGQLPAPLDDTFLIVVSSKIKDVLVTSTAPTSPYRSLLSGRMFFDGPQSNWGSYEQLFDLYDSMGMHNLAGYFFAGWSAGEIDAPSSSNVGPDWSPAFDEANFLQMMAHGRTLGHLLTAYTAFNQVPPGAPPGVYDPTELARDANGVPKTGLQLPFPLLGIEASGIHAQYEADQLRQRNANLAYLDIQTYGSVGDGPDGDHLDQQAASPWAKTSKQGHLAQKSWFEQMRQILGGPLLGEGSIGTQDSNMEFLWYGFVDSVQRVINTGAGQPSINLPAGSPHAPTNWPIIPEYEWRVAAAHQINHGNGLYDRFFGRSDGPSVVDMATGQLYYPLTEDALDLYQAFLITYGHAGFVVTNGVVGKNQGTMLHACAADTYFMSNALQSLYYESPVKSIRYYHEGQFRSFERVIFQTETTDTFRHIPIRIEFHNGLRIYVNHSDAPLDVTENGVLYTLPDITGWLAEAPGRLLSFSAIAPTTGGNRIDYCNAVGQYEFFNGRYLVNGYGGITTNIKRRKWTIRSTNLAVTELVGNGVFQYDWGPPPALVGIEIEPSGALTLEVGGRAGLEATAHYDNGGIRDVTTLFQWSSTNGVVAAVNASGIAHALQSGQTTLDCTAPSGQRVSDSIVVTVP